MDSLYVRAISDAVGRFYQSIGENGQLFYPPGWQPAFVRFHAGWPVRCNDPAAEVIAEGLADRPFDPAGGMGAFPMTGNVLLPVIVARPVGKGKMVVIGDTDFAGNVNLENKDGTPIEGLRENSDFWRWFLAKLRGLPPWNPNRHPAAAGVQP